MSRIGKTLIAVPKGVDVKIAGSKVTVKGPKGLLEREMHPTVDIKLEDGHLSVVPKSKAKEFSKFHGLVRSLLNNMVIGVSEGFKKELTLVGVGYRAQAKGKGISLALGYSNPIAYEPLPGVEIKVEKPTILSVSGINKEDVGQVAAKIRSFRPPEPYHGKGVRYSNEQVRTKVGKAAAKT